MWRSLSCIGLLIMIYGCGGGGSSSTPPAPAPPPPPPPPNTVSFTVELTAGEIVGGSVETGTASIDFEINLDDDTISGTMTLTGVDADGVTINQGFAGETGDVLVTLNQDSSTQWSIPVSTNFIQADQDALNAGGIYLVATTAASPDGAVRGQAITGNIILHFVTLSGAQRTPVVVTGATAIGAVTLDPDTGGFVAHLNGWSLDDATFAHVHLAIAGRNGGVSIELMQDPDDVAHWFSDGATLDDDGMAAYNGAELYFNVHTPANPGGEVRGQIIPAGVDVVFTTLVGGDVVPPSGSANLGIASATLLPGSTILTMHVNVTGLDDATGVTIDQAPISQNGPSTLLLVQDPSDVAHWSIEDMTLTDAQEAALNNQGLYVNVATPAFPAGEVRGQVEPTASMGGPSGAFTVSAVDPSNGSTVPALPSMVSVTFDRDVLASSVSVDSVDLQASGGDGSFGDGNELALLPVNATATAATMTIDLTGLTGGDDTYQLTLDGSSATPLTDTVGVVLDGDGDGAPGGDFVSTFTVQGGVGTNPQVFFSRVQEQVFTPSCALSGCHAGASPAQGMNLSEGQAYANIVNVPSNEFPSLNRVEPNDPDNSYLIQKIEGTAQVGARMPLGAGPLPNDIIQ
ncbi:MAG: CHRD domain-containing protein, partial [Gammaproteobacteria bacterium]|nr:CHRD domain-containing protein [Gammaproteobacteria bacterium]